MRPSPLKHTLAILRREIGPDMTQKEMAKLLDRSPVTIQKIELGKLPLAESLAEEITLQTGVDIAWLLANDVNQPPVDRTGKPYSRQEFERVQSKMKSTLQGEGDLIGVKFITWFQIANLTAVADAALKSGRYQLFIYKCARAIEQLEEQFGIGKGFITENKAATVLGLKGDEKTLAKHFEDGTVQVIHGLFQAIDARWESGKSTRQASSQSSPRPRQQRASR